MSEKLYNRILVSVVFAFLRQIVQLQVQVLKHGGLLSVFLGKDQNTSMLCWQRPKYVNAILKPQVKLVAGSHLAHPLHWQRLHHQMNRLGLQTDMKGEMEPMCSC